jgi:molybdenum cofactor cytidylyltransferase
VTSEIEGILLAAGESRRMGYPKPLLRIGGEAFVEHVARTMLQVVARLIVVVGAHAERVRAAVPRDSRTTIAENREWARGQLSSLKVGIQALGPGCRAALVHLADHPTVRLDTFRAVADAYVRNPAPIVIARHGGRRGHPVIFAREVFPELDATLHSEGARRVVNADPKRVVYVDVDDPGVVLDLDTPDDLARSGLPGPPGGPAQGGS